MYSCFHWDLKRKVLTVSYLFLVYSSTIVLTWQLNSWTSNLVSNNRRNISIVALQIRLRREFFRRQGRVMLRKLLQDRLQVVKILCFRRPLSIRSCVLSSLSSVERHDRMKILFYFLSYRTEYQDDCISCLMFISDMNIFSTCKRKMNQYGLFLSFYPIILKYNVYECKIN